MWASVTNENEKKKNWNLVGVIYLLFLYSVRDFYLCIWFYHVKLTNLQKHICTGYEWSMELVSTHMGNV